MKVLISGSSGLIGTALIDFLNKQKIEVFRLVRNKSTFTESQIFWDPISKTIETDKLNGMSGVIHLAGENIASGRWSQSRKLKIKSSRSIGTGFLSEALSNLENPPKVFISASGMGYYGNNGNKIVDEKSSIGSGFLPEICSSWESACLKAKERGIRVVNTRIGVVLSIKGGALKTMITPFRFCLGGVLGNGKQYMSWISIDDICKSIHHIIMSETIEGPVNLVSPNPVTNYEFTKTLGKVLGRPTLLPAPAFMLKLLFGEMAEELLLWSYRIKPGVLLDSGYEFEYPDLENALRIILEK